MCLATKQFYVQRSSEEYSLSVIAPLLEDGLKKAALACAPTLKRKNAPHEVDDDERPRPLLASTQKQKVNHLESNDAPCPLSPTATITFRQALVATDKPRQANPESSPYAIVRVVVLIPSSHRAVALPLL